MDTDNYAIRVRDIRKTYKDGSGRVVALDSESVDIEKGKITAVVGPSGSGKSTMLQIVGGLDKPDSGEVMIDGQIVNALSERKLSAFRNKKIGFVFQAFNLQPYLTVQDNVCVPLLINKHNQTQARLKAIVALKKLGMEEQAKKYPNQISGGQMQRTAIARALVNKPSVILADEPTGNLDAENAQTVMNIFRDLADSGMTVVIITHDNTVAAAADNVIKLKGGKIQ